MPHVRRAVPAEIARLIEIQRTGVRKAEQIPAEEFPAFLRADTARLFVEEFDGRLRSLIVLGFRRGGRSVRVFSLTTDPAHRRQGAAGRLMDHAERWAHKAGYMRMTADVPVNNAPAIWLFERRGYIRAARVRDLLEPEMTTIRCFKML